MAGALSPLPEGNEWVGERANEQAVMNGLSKRDECWANAAVLQIPRFNHTFLKNNNNKKPHKKPKVYDMVHNINMLPV